MILAFAFIACALFFGVGAGRLLKELDDKHKIIAFACAAGLLAGVWLSFLFSWALGALNGLSITLSSLALLGAGFLLNSKARERSLEKTDRKALAAVLFFMILLSALNLRLVMVENGGIIAGANIWGDYPLHTGIVYSFSERANYPPTYPQFLGVPLAYPFLIEFFSAILLSQGFNLGSSLVIPHLLFYFALFSFAFFLAKKATGSTAAGVIVLLLFFLNGNYGIVHATSDAMQSNDAIQFLTQLPKAYSHIESENIEFMNVLFSTFLPQRSAIMGFAIAFAIFYLVFGARGKDKRKLAVCGAMAGLLPLVHLPSFAAAIAVAAAFFVFDLMKSKKRVETAKNWAWFFAPAILFSLPQALFIRGQVSDVFYTQRWGWMFEQTPSLQEFAWFWIANAWIPLVLGIYGFFKASKETKIFTAPFAVFFVAANSFKLAPWDWDSIKILTYWFFAVALLASIPLAQLWRKRELRFKALALLLIGVSIASGVLTLAWWWNDRPTLYSARDLAIAEWVRENTPAQAIWITSNAHNHVIPSLTGRQTVLGLKWWAYSHGLESWKVPIEKKIDLFYATADCAIVKEFNASFVFLGPQEKGIEKADSSKFDSPYYEKVFDRKLQGHRTTIYKTKC